MKFFEKVGIQHQDDANTVEEAQRAFQDSCRRCAMKGRETDCERECKIARYHAMRVEVLETVAQNREAFEKLRRGEIHSLSEA